MVLKVKVNMPKDTVELINKATETMAKILINKLQPSEVNQLIDLLGKEDFNITL